MSDWSVTYNCYEVGHTWTPYCTEAALDLFTIVFGQGIQLYIPLYLFTQALQKRYDLEAFLATFKNILRSSIYLGASGFFVIQIICGMKLLTGKFYYSLTAFVPAFFGSLLGVLIEKRSRRGALALYCANIASETVFKMMCKRGYLRPVQNGEVMLFSMSIALYLYMLKKQLLPDGHDPLTVAFKFLHGRDELRQANPEKQTRAHDQNDNIKPLTQNVDSATTTNGISQVASKSKQDLALQEVSHLNLANFFRLFRHRLCPHQNESCFTYVMKSFLSNFALGWLGQVAVSTLLKPKKLSAAPMETIRKNITSTRNLNFGLFLGSFGALFKSLNCILRWSTNETKDWHIFASALAAGSSALFFPNTTITMHIMWKVIEALFVQAVKKYQFPYAHQIILVLYSLSVAQMAFVGILEPDAMRPSYMKFVDRITDHRLHHFNRIVLDMFGTEASKGYEEYFPNLCLKYTTKHFQETVFTWLL